MKVSIIVPVYNEEDNISLLYEAVEKSAKTMGIPWELILIYDGSQDSSLKKIKSIVKDHPKQVSAVVLRRNFGQTAAIAAGIDHSNGEISSFLMPTCKMILLTSQSWSKNSLKDMI